MRKAEETRYMPLLVFIGILMLILIIRLFVLTVLQEDKWSEAAENNSTKEIYTAAPRGEILDRNGKVLAGNKHTFSVNINRGKADAKTLNDQISRLLAIFETNGDKYYDNFPIKISDSGKYYYTYEKDRRKWQKSENIPYDYSAKEAFAHLRKTYNIGSDLTDVQAQKELQNKYNKYPEITVARMEYTADVEKDAFMEKYGLDKGLSAKKAFREIREQMEIDKSLSDRKAREIMVVRNELKSMGYMSYMPVTVAQNVSKMTIVRIEEESENFSNVEVATETRRYYPGGKTAAHILGYMGAISESEKSEYIKKGYQSTDLIGRNGVEASYEDVLHGKDGVKKVQVDSRGNVTSVISQTDPVKGKDLYLTLDLDLQKDLEDALKRGIECTRKGGTFKSKYGSFTYSRHYSHCRSGAAVAIDVKTGNVLAMASYPAYDPNKFSGGISAKDWEKVQSENPNDPLSPAPLYNIATMS
ncbi:MAG: penicillin-binding protein, partial [Firmicutes bacterium]|nr:penicillin-binding protein [Bacillota bacterium]